MSVPAQKNPGFSHRVNPSSRNSEIRDPMRKSFTENPFTKPLINVPIRGSSPKTPANTPTDIQRRNATSREYIVDSFCDLEDKENGKDSNQKAVKLRSPATTPKGTKNFMSPTISAASKVSATPKKKILIERNESIRSSFSVSEPKNPSMEDSDSQLEEPILIHKECEDSFKKSAILDDKVKKSVKFETISSFGSSMEAECEDSFKKSAISDDKVKKSVKFETVSNFGSSMEADLVNLDPTFKISPRPLSANLAPLDADPLMPPYDPKNNYLSPRPQFLHYKPNPRIEIFLKGKETRQLEDSFMLESDTEITEETQSDDSEKDSENISSEDTIEHEDENEKELQESEMVEESEMRPASASSAAPKSVVEAKGFRFRSKFVVACLLFIVLAWLMLPITEYSPAIFSNLTQKLQHFSPDMTEIATAKFGMLAGNLSLWSASSYLNLCNGIQNLREVHRQSPLQFYNLTDLGTQKKIMHIEVETANEVEMWRENVDPDYEEFYEEEQVMEKQDGIENGPFNRDDYKLQAEEKSSANENSVVEEFNIHSLIEVETANEVVLLRDYEDLDYEEEPVMKKQENLDNEDPDYEDYYEEQAREEKHDSLENEDSFNGDEEDYELQAEERSENNPHYENTEPIVEQVNTPSSQPVVMEFPAEETVEIEVTKNAFSLLEDKVIMESWVPAEAETEGGRGETVIGNSENDAIRVEEDTLTETLHLAVIGEKQNFPIYEFGGISLLLLLSLVAVAKAYAYRKMASSYSANQERMISKKMDPNCEVMSSRMWQTDVVTVRESCPSEMSSLHRSSSYNKKSKKSFAESEKQGAAGTSYSRRESLASSDYSTTASPSYGSFTTFEKIPYKHNGDGEEEIVTPVRRSSRIRQQVTSP